MTLLSSRDHIMGGRSDDSNLGYGTNHGIAANRALTINNNSILGATTDPTQRVLARLIESDLEALSVSAVIDCTSVLVSLFSLILHHRRRAVLTSGTQVLCTRRNRTTIYINTLHSVNISKSCTVEHVHSSKWQIKSKEIYVTSEIRRRKKEERKKEKNHNGKV